MIDWYENDIGPFTVWHANCYGVHLFLCVGSVDEKTGNLSLYELQTKKYYSKKDKKDGVVLVYDKRGSCFKAKDRYSCLIGNRLKPNCFTKANIILKPEYDENDEIVLKYKMLIGSSLYDEVKEMGYFKDYDSLEFEFSKIGGYDDYKRLINTYWVTKKIATQSKKDCDA